MDAYSIISLLGAIILVVVFFTATINVKTHPASASLGPNVVKEYLKGCETNKDCDWGVCSFGKCVCFDDSQCGDGKCDLATGVCYNMSG